MPDTVAQNFAHKPDRPCGGLRLKSKRSPATGNEGSRDSPRNAFGEESVVLSRRGGCATLSD
jgi:hypothetical protein